MFTSTRISKDSGLVTIGGPGGWDNQVIARKRSRSLRDDSVQREAGLPLSCWRYAHQGEAMRAVIYRMHSYQLDNHCEGVVVAVLCSESLESIGRQASCQKAGIGIVCLAVLCKDFCASFLLAFQAHSRILMSSMQCYAMDFLYS